MILKAPFLARVVVRVTALAALILGLSYLPQVTLAQQPQNDAAKAADILALVNTWRIQSGLWPLTVNPTLESLALGQATYVFSFLDNITNEDQYHYDAQNRNPRDRAAAAGWPIYGNNPLHIEVGENAGIGSSKFVMKFWRDSPIHAKAALSSTYREVGVAALPLKGGQYFYIMDFGARPGVLPVVPNDDGKHLWLTDENSRYAKIKGGTKVRLLDLSGNPLTTAVNWIVSLPLPDGLSADKVQVAYINGNNQITSSTNRGPFTSGPAAAPTAVAAVPTATPGVAAAVPTNVPSTRAPDVTPTVPPPTVTPVPTQVTVPTVDPAKADLILTYDSSALFLRNVTKNPLDLTGLSLLGGGVTLGVPLWAKVSDFPVSAFPASHCLAAQLSAANVSAPATCKWIRSIITLQPAKVFWAATDFIVSYNGTQIAVCGFKDKQCYIDLP